MEQTLAEFLQAEARDEGRREGALATKQDDLLGMIAEKFGAVPEIAASRVRAIQETETLDRLLRQVIHANTIEEMGFQ